MNLIEDLDSYANLLLSVKTHKSERLLEPFEVAILIQRLIDETGENLGQISRRIGIGEDQIRNFLKLLKLPKQVHYALGWSNTGDEQLAFTTGAIISELDEKQDMELLSKIAINSKLKKDEARRILQLKKKSPQKSIDECVTEVIHLRPIVEKGYLLINSMSDSTIQELVKIVSDRHSSLEILILEIINRAILKGKAEKALVRNNTIFLTLDEEGYDSILQIQNEKKIRLRELLDYLVKEGLTYGRR